VLKVKKDDPETTFEAWIRVNVTFRLMLLFILPSEMGLESGGFRLAETLHDKDVDELINQLGQSPIS